MRLVAFVVLGLLAPLRAAEASPALSLLAAPGSLRSDEVTLVWDRPADAGRATRYEVLRDGEPFARTKDCFLVAGGLAPDKTYTFTVRGPETAGRWTAVTLRTKPAPVVVSILAHGAVGDGRTLNTKAIQAAIDACPPGGTVLVPEGRFLSGALFLKSDLTFEVAKGGQLRGSADPADYRPMVRNRFEGWEMETLASLLNAGKLDARGPANVRHLSIRGEGRIVGGGGALAERTLAAHGARGRGRLICLMNAADVEVAGLTLEGSPSWTLHFIYSERVTCRGLTLRSAVRNGDGIDPDSSVDTLILGSTFETKDDCIAVKSGKNPEGNVIARPTERLRVAGCRFLRGHGISIGSEISGGIRGVKVEDCVAGALLHGFQIKALPARGGFVEDVEVVGCDLQKISILSDLDYNRDGEPAPTAPLFRGFRFRDLDLTQGDPAKPVILVNGFAAEGRRAQAIQFERVRLPAKASITLDQAQDVGFKDVTTADGSAPTYRESRSERIAR